ncbi:MAG: HD domain-containing protein [Butyribacter sp.]|nr:HD domain-containing protein [bacterium]MDY3855380.1 HD domain-containing protein [Butyribacter sp.]
MKKWHYIENRKRVSILTYLVVLTGVTGYQMLHPQALITSIGITIIVLGVYMNQGNVAVEELSYYHDEMIMGFATLVENKDDNTGGHIKRTTKYVELLTTELQKRGYYRQVLTKDYLNNLCMAAPMHDVGKISIPDAVLQKPGKLTDEEFEIMKTHAVSGGQIIQKTFGHLENEQYTQLAYQIARYHHEKWNGSGYPDGLKAEEIPLGARIMAVADVFDAVSERRCYREAMPLNKCFQIIEEGSGSHFDPLLVEIFLDIRDEVEEVHYSLNEEEKSEISGESIA